MPNALDVVTHFTADVADLKKGAGEAADAVKGVGPASALTSTAVLGMAAVAVGALGAMTLAAADDQAAQAQLEQAYRNTGAAVGDYNGQINDAIDAGIALGFTDDQTRAALTSLITATGDAAKANADLKIAQDIARFAGVDLATAADAVAKAQAGQATQLTRLLPGLEKGKTATETLANAQALAAGSADTYAASTKGQADVMGASFAQLGQEIGSAFLPVLDLLTKSMVGVSRVMNENSGLVKALAVVVGILAAGIIAANIALKAFEAIQVAVKVATAAWTAVQWLLNAALDANPVGLLVIAITALVAGLILVYQNSKTVRDAIAGIVDWIQQLVHWIETAVGKLGDFLNSLNPLSGISLPSLPFTLGASATGYAGAGASSRGVGSQGVSSVQGAVVVNVYGGDPRRIVSAVREGFRRWTLTDGATAPDREW